MSVFLAKFLSPHTKNKNFLGKCPDLDYVSDSYNTSLDYYPAGCLTNPNALSCTKVWPPVLGTAPLNPAQIYSPNVDYVYHMNVGTLCNSGSNVCSLDGCSVAPCSFKYIFP
jgi:hypothetical protein